MTLTFTYHSDLPPEAIEIFEQVYTDGRPLNCRGGVCVVAHAEQKPVGCIIAADMDADGTPVAFIERGMILSPYRTFSNLYALWKAWKAWCVQQGFEVAGTALTPEDTPRTHMLVRRGAHALPAGKIGGLFWYIIPLLPLLPPLSGDQNG